MGWVLGYDFGGLRVGQGRTGWVRGLVSRVSGPGGLCWGMGDWFWGLGACLGLGRADSGPARGGGETGSDGFWDCGFGLWGRTGWDVGESGCFFFISGLR